MNGHNLKNKTALGLTQKGMDTQYIKDAPVWLTAYAVSQSINQYVNIFFQGVFSLVK
jgi:hypothetical protein